MKYIKHIILTALVLLLTAATSAWAMQIYISYPSWPTGTTGVNGNGNLVIEIEGSDSGENLKAKIEDKTGLKLALAYQHLYFNNTEIENNKMLSYYGITSNSVLTLTYDQPYKDGNTWVFTMPAANKLLEVENYNTYTLTLATNDPAMGTVKIDSAGGISFLDSVIVKDAAANEYYVLPGAKVAVKAIPAAGYQLLKWEDNSTDLHRTVTVTRDTIVAATFGLPTPGLTPEGELTTSGTRFLDEYGNIVGTPRLMETGGLIDESVVPMPTATTSPATDLTQTSATLNGTVSNPDNVAVTAQGFEWKATTGGTYTTVGATGETMTYSLTGLTANTGYTYRAFVTTASGTNYGDEVTFTTPAL